MKREIAKFRAFLGTALLSVSLGAVAEHPLEEVDVYGEKINEFSDSVIRPDVMPVSTTDAAALFKEIPGGNINYNGGVSGQVQYRGMYGPRMNVRIDDAKINSGGPNWMDPPLHYLPTSLVESVEVVRGIPSVSTGAGIGGYAQAKSKSSKFTDSKTVAPQGEVFAGGSDVNGGYKAGGILGFANDTHRVHLIANHDEAGDTEFDGGTIEGTDYKKRFFGFGYGLQTDNSEFSLDLRRTNTDNSGNPVFPLDIAFFKTNQFNLGLDTKFKQFDISAQFFGSNVKHQMNNFTLRPAPDFSALPLAPFVGTDRRVVDANSDSYGWSLSASTDLYNGSIKFGTDGSFAEHNAVVNDPDFTLPAFANELIQNFNDAQQDEFGFFVEWKNDESERLGIETGIRINHVMASADSVNAVPAELADRGITVNGVTNAALALRDNFNNADRNQSDTNFDAVLKFDYELTDTLKAEIGFARKTRSASYIERYMWIPLEVNAGLGDGNNYVGNINLDPEKAHQIELGLNFDNGQTYFSPRAYYKRIDDYIQGVATTDTSTVTFSNLAAGDSTPLVFSNVDAEIYGFDAGYGYAFNANWRIDGVTTYTRGKRRDISDNLYRIAPLNTRLSLTYSQDKWQVTLQGVLVAEQDKISNTIAGSIDTNANNTDTNNSNPTDGYGLLNLYGQFSQGDKGIQVQAGIENILDENYTDHLTGFNRNSGSSIAVGQRLNGAGRNLFANMIYRW